MENRRAAAQVTCFSSRELKHVTWAAALHHRRARARKQCFFRRCMQNGPADQADLADFIARGNKPDLVALLRHAGERLPSGSDTAADHRVVLLQYLRRAPGHLILALESLRAGDDVAEGALYGAATELLVLACRVSWLVWLSLL